MSLARLNKQEKEITCECMKMILYSGILTSDFETRLGVGKEKLEDFVSQFPDIDDTDNKSEEAIAINNCLNEICHGIKFSQNGWKRWFSYSREEVLSAYKKWRETHG